MPNESDRTAKWMASLRKIPGSKWWKNHGTEYSERGLPDVMGVVRGTMFALEVKVGANWISDQQRARLQELDASGAVAGVVILPAQEFVPASELSKTRGKCRRHAFSVDNIFLLEAIAKGELL